jgi:hypothetical protein
MLLYLVIVLCGMAYFACLSLGDASPQGDATPDSAEGAWSELDDDVDTAEEGSTPAPDKSKDEPPSKEEGDVDKTANWSKDMDEFTQHIPDELKQKFKNRVEQGGRWGKGAPDGDPELQTKYDKVQSDYDAMVAAAEKFGSWLSDGPKQFSDLGPLEFLEQLQTVDPSIFVPLEKKDEPAKQDDEEMPQWAKELKSERDALKAERLKVEQDAKDKAAADKALADFEKAYKPAFEDAVSKVKVKDADKKPVSEAMDKLAKGFYIWTANETPGKATPEGAVKDMLDALNTIHKARLANGPQPPEGELLLDPARITEPLAGGSYNSLLDDFEDGFEKDSKKQ